MENKSVDYIDKTTAKTLHELFQIRVSRNPDDCAYRYFHNESNSWREYSWQASLNEVNNWRKALLGSGLQKGQSVGIMLRNCPEWIFIEQACMAQGIISVPLYPNDRPDNVSHILNEAEIKLIVIEDQQQWATLVSTKNELIKKPIVISLLDLDESESENESKEEITHFQYRDWLNKYNDQALDENYKNFNPNELATIVYTSGTTGRPKGVMLSHLNILSNADAGIHAIDIYKSDLFLSFLPLSHTLERTVGYYIPVMTGATVAFSRSVPLLAEDLLIIKPTVLISVPRIFERVYGKVQAQLALKSPIAKKLFAWTESIGWQRFESSQGQGKSTWRMLFWPVLEKIVAKKLLDKLGGRLRFTISGGAPLPETISHLFISFGLPILQGYGLTETSPIVSVNTHEKNIPSSIGPPLPGIDIRLDINSELQTRSECVMLGYWKNEQATSEMFTDDGWLKTGDLAKIENEHIYITGRLKEILVLSNGEKVPPVDMEIAICLHGLFEQAIVIGEARPYLTAIAVLDPTQWNKLAMSLSLDPDKPENLKNNQVKTKVLSLLCDCLSNFPGYAQVRQISLSLEPWTDSNYFLTPSLKIRRNVIMDHFKDEIDQMYQGH